MEVRDTRRERTKHEKKESNDTGGPAFLQIAALDFSKRLNRSLRVCYPVFAIVLKQFI